MRDPESLARAIRTARPGDTIAIADGTYRDLRIVFSARGEERRPITLRAATPGKVVLNGASRLQIAGHDLVVDGLLFTDGAVPSGSVIEFRRSATDLATRCRLTNCAIVDYNPPDIKVDTKWVSLYGEANRVDHCYFAGKTNSGTTLVVWVGDRPNGHTIDFNHFGPRPRLGFNGGETIRVGTSQVSMNVSRTLVAHNLFEKCDGEIEAISNKSCENTYRHNTFSECSATLCLRHGNRCLVEGNFFLGNHSRGSGGIRVIGQGHVVVNNYLGQLEGDGSRAAISLLNGLPESPLNGYFQVKDVVIAFNTLVDNRSNLELGVGDGTKATLPPRDSTIANNIVVGKHAPLVRHHATPINLRWLGNVMFGADVGTSAREGILITDPRLIEAENGLRRPSADSPVFGHAVGDFAAVTADIDGQPRPSKRDVGCDQRSSAPILFRPLAAGDVGPAWRR